MRKLKLQVQMSVDGFIAGPNGEMDWMMWDWDDTLKKYVSDLTDPVDTILLGRKLAEGFIDAWQANIDIPEMADFAHKMIDSPKIVFSNTMKTCNWINTEIAQRELVEEVTALKNKPGGDIIAYGGASFVGSLIQHGLIDEFHLFINPVVIGAGMPIFNKLEGYQKLNLVKAAGFDCGITVLHYTK